MGEIILDAIRFYFENYKRTHTGGRAPTIDPPDPDNLPEYSSIEFSARVFCLENFYGYHQTPRIIK